MCCFHLQTYNFTTNTSDQFCFMLVTTAVCWALCLNASCVEADRALKVLQLCLGAAFATWAVSILCYMKYSRILKNCLTTALSKVSGNLWVRKLRPPGSNLDLLSIERPAGGGFSGCKKKSGFMVK